MTTFNGSEKCLKRRVSWGLPVEIMTKSPVSKILRRSTLYKRRLVMVIFKVLLVLSLMTTIVLFSSVNRQGLKLEFVTLPCGKEVKVAKVTSKNIFQPVEGTDVYVYSAYLDRRVPGQSKVRVIGIAPLNPGPVHCQIHYMNGSVISTTAQAVLTLTQEEKQRIQKFYYKPHMFSCNDTQKGPIQMVSLTATPCGHPSNQLEVFKIDDKRERSIKSTGLCLKTLHEVKSPYNLIEFIEAQRHLGVTHFYVYGVNKISPSAQKALNHYINNKIIFLIPWKLPVKNAPFFHQDGQVAAYAKQAINNDCVYRAMSFSDNEILFMHDFNEYFVPRRPNLNNIHQLLKLIHEHNNYNLHNTYASYSFFECKFCVQSKDLDEDPPNLITLNKTSRHMCLKTEMDEVWWQDVLKLKNRQLATRKPLVHPMRVIYMGVHAVIEQLPKYKREFKVPTFFAVMSRFKETKYERCEILDNTMSVKYERYLKPRVKRLSKIIGIKPI